MVWQVRGLGPGAKNRVNWSLQYGVAITEWDPNEQTFSGVQIMDAELKKAYQVITEEEDIPVIDPTSIEPAGLQLSSDQIKLHNDTSQKFHMGFSVDGNIIAVSQSTGNQWANFVVHPTYYVALYKSVKRGMLVDSDLQIGPVKVEFTDGNTNALVQCVSQNGKDILQASLIE